MSETDLIHATVQKVVLRGRHGPYAVATSKDIEGSITFSLHDSVWKEKRLPESGIIVVLLDLIRKTAGWRAMNARAFRPSDEQQSRNKV